MNSKSRLAETTAETLRKKITSGEWALGAKIPTEPELCEALGIGRSTLREAVRTLTTLGMLEPLTARGTFVRSTEPIPELLFSSFANFDPAELVGLRRALDVEAAQSAAARSSRSQISNLEAELARESTWLRNDTPSDQGPTRCARFHGLVVAASGNSLVERLSAVLSGAMAEIGLDKQIDEAQDAAQALGEHDRIFTSIRSGDVAAAAHLMALHSDAALRSLSFRPIVTDLTTLVRSRSNRAGSKSMGIA